MSRLPQAPGAFGGKVPCSRVLQHCVVAPLLLPWHFPIIALPLRLELGTPDRLVWTKTKIAVEWSAVMVGAKLSKLPP